MERLHGSSTAGGGPLHTARSGLPFLLTGLLICLPRGTDARSVPLRALTIGNEKLEDLQGYLQMRCRRVVSALSAIIEGAC